MKLKQLFAITAIASALVLTGCKEDKISCIKGYPDIFFSRIYRLCFSYDNF